MVNVDVTRYPDLEKALRVFRTKVRQAHILELSNSKAHYVSPSEKRHRSRRQKVRR